MAHAMPCPVDLFCPQDPVHAVCPLTAASQDHVLTKKQNKGEQTALHSLDPARRPKPYVRVFCSGPAENALGLGGPGE